MSVFGHSVAFLAISHIGCRFGVYSHGLRVQMQLRMYMVMAFEVQLPRLDVLPCTARASASHSVTNVFGIRDGRMS